LGEKRESDAEQEPRNGEAIFRAGLPDSDLRALCVVAEGAGPLTLFFFGFGSQISSAKRAVGSLRGF
jgi:hypothetical protein